MLAVLPFDEEDEALARAGTVYINMPNPVDASAHWGVYGSSGWGREMGSGAIDLYTGVKSVWTSLA